jgi:hypothetical protein
MLLWFDIIKALLQLECFTVNFFLNDFRVECRMKFQFQYFKSLQKKIFGFMKAKQQFCKFPGFFLRYVSQLIL